MEALRVIFLSTWAALVLNFIKYIIEFNWKIAFSRGLGNPFMVKWDLPIWGELSFIVVKDEEAGHGKQDP